MLPVLALGVYLVGLPLKNTKMRIGFSAEIILPKKFLFGVQVKIAHFNWIPIDFNSLIRK